MAENQPVKKRRVKNPETFRERALKAGQEGDQPKRITKARGKLAGGIAWIFRPLGKGLAWLAGLRIFSWLRRPLRFIGKLILPAYFRNSWKELKQVTWPRWRESRQLTFAVLIFAVIFGAGVALVDYGLDKVFQHLLLK